MTKKEKKKYNPYYLFLDLETTNLKPESSYILEVSAILLNKGLEQVGEKFHSLCVPNWNPDILWNLIKTSMCDDVLDMHTKNGLLDEIKTLVDSGGDSLPLVDVVENNILNWLEAMPLEDNSRDYILSGHSINSLDKPFIKYYMPKFFALLSHRTLDISSHIRFHTDVCEIPYNSENPFVAHRAEQDNLAAIHEARYLKAWNKKAAKLIKDYDSEYEYTRYKSAKGNPRFDLDI
jgi:oligoribonuclease (3'-5' exoribonuclease)